MKSYNHKTVFSGMVINIGQISDAKTLAALLRWELRARSGDRCHA